jgi:hypothetical protein
VEEQNFIQSATLVGNVAGSACKEASPLRLKLILYAQILNCLKIRRKSASDFISQGIK